MSKYPQISGPDVVQKPNPIVGGHEYHNFDQVSFSSLLTKIEIWKGDPYLEAIRVTSLRGETFTFGAPKGELKALSLSTAQLVQGISVWADEFGITKFNLVTAKQQFEWGTNVEKAVKTSFNVGTGLLFGFTVKHNPGIIALSPIFPASGEVYVIVKYDNPPTGTEGIESVQLDAYEHTNDSDQPYDWSWNRSMDKEISSTWTQSQEVTAGMSFEFHAGVPELAEAGGEVHWEISATTEHEMSESETRHLEWSESGTMPPHTHLLCTATTEQGKLDLKYHAEVYVRTGIDGIEGYLGTETGVFRGTRFSRVHVRHQNVSTRA